MSEAPRKTPRPPVSRRVAFGDAPRALSPSAHRAPSPSVLADSAPLAAAHGGFDSSLFRRMRDGVAAAIAGESRRSALEELGLSGLAVSDLEGHEIVRLGSTEPEGVRVSRHVLDAGANAYVLRLWPDVGEPLASSIALVVETLLFRLAPAPGTSDFIEGWRRLGVITQDRAMEEPYRRLLLFAAQPVTVMVHGESGCGKEAVARAVHALSPRAAGAFVPVNVPAIPPALVESELFGHVKGAFTGAERDRIGLAEAAAGGTIFFDEIGDLAAPLQAKLLRALQDREIRRVGENRSRRIDVRVVSATSRDLAFEVENGRFREDLFYRLHVAVVLLPPLRERGRDAQLLARQFLDQYAKEYGRGKLQWSADALAIIGSHTWPGNVRELQNAVAQAAALVEKNGTVGAAHLPEAVRGARRGNVRLASYRSRIDAHRRRLIADALERASGNRSRAARDLGLSRQALAYLIRKLDVAEPRRSHG